VLLNADARSIELRDDYVHVHVHKTNKNCTLRMMLTMLALSGVQGNGKGIKGGFKHNERLVGLGD